MKKNIKLIHDKNLDNNKKVKEQSEYYENIEIEKEFDLAKSKFIKAKTKRVNILIPNSLFLESEKISKITGIGYQNTLKTAMAIGLHQLSKQL
jgi:predicted DNA binding CopG/RHH family protein